MFIGHFAVGFAAKRATPQLSLATLVAAAAFADLLWPILVAAGVEQVRIDPGNTAVTPLDFVSYPYSHSLLMLIVWGVIFGAICQRVANGRHALIVVAALVVSHWVLDFVTHRPDIPLYPGGPKYGLGLWNSVPATALVEVAMYAVGVWIYLRSTRARDAIGRWSFYAFAAFLAFVYFVDLGGEPPPSVRALYIGAIVGGIVLIAWSWWIDRHRVSAVKA